MTLPHLPAAAGRQAVLSVSGGACCKDGCAGALDCTLDALLSTRPVGFPIMPVNKTLPVMMDRYAPLTYTTVNLIGK